MMNRERVLVVVFVIALVLFAADWLYRNAYETPLRDAENAIAALEERQHEGNLEIRRHQNRLPELDALGERSLPLDLAVAVTDYRSWLLKAIESSGLQPANLDSSPPANFRGVYRRIAFNAQTRGTLGQLTKFLHRFYASNYLHKLRSMSLTPTSDGSLEISFAIDSLSVPAVASDKGLPAESAKEPQEQTATLERYSEIVRRNIFREGQPIASQIRLSAITRDRQRRRQAWLQFQTNGQTRLVTQGDQWVVDGTHLRVVEVDTHSVNIAIDGSERTVRIGQTLQ